MLTSDAEREELLVEFARPGLERGERVWCVTDDVRATEDALTRARPLGALAARRRLVLHHPPAEVRRLLELLGGHVPPIELRP